MESRFVDNYDHVHEFVFYSPVNIPGKGCDMNLLDSQISSYCSCTNGCSDVNTCICLSKSGKNYENHKLADSKIFGDCCCVECNDRCLCDATKCENRLAQFGPATNLKIDNSGQKGYGLFTTNEIRKGQLVCEYAGEVIGEEEATKRRLNDNVNYIFTLNEFVDNRNVKTIIDATCIGNIGRYINHSCDPNCVVVPVRVDSLVPKLGIFACKIISAGEEISYKYGDVPDSEINSNNLKLCLCGSVACSKYLPCNI